MLKALVTVLLLLSGVNLEQSCWREEDGTCASDANGDVKSHLVSGPRYRKYLKSIADALSGYTPSPAKNCSLYESVIIQDLKPFESGITKEMIESVIDRGTKYQIINHKLYREPNCMYPARCSGVEYFILKVIEHIPDVEFILNTRDWPQVSAYHNQLVPVFSFSKTSAFNDIMYPAWSFWDGGPAISLYPQGLGRWDKHRKQIAKEADIWPWEKKKKLAFFRGSRTSSERDALILLSRERPDLVDAQYTKNQAWKSDKDTLYAPPASEVPLESHCHYRYLFNFRGVAASFRFKHLFLCRSLVFHVGDEWNEFFYFQMIPWIHYIPVKSTATKEEIRELLEFAMSNDEVSQEIAQRGYDFIWKHLRMKDVECYWKSLLKNYAKLLRFTPNLNATLKEVRSS